MTIRLLLATTLAVTLIAPLAEAAPPSGLGQVLTMRDMSDQDMVGAAPLEQRPDQPNAARKEIVASYNAARALYNAKNYDAGYAKILETDAIADQNAYEKELIVRLKFILALRAGKQDVALGLIDQLPAAVTTDVKASYILEITRQFQEKQDLPAAITAAKRYLALGGPETDKASGVLWRGYYTLHDYPNALSSSLDALAAQEQKGAVPDETLLKIIKSSAAQLKDAAHASFANAKLATYYPNPARWGELIQDTINQPGYPKVNLALDIFRLMAATGSLTEGVQINNYAALALESGIPEEAKSVLDQGTEKGLLGDANGQAALRQRATAESQADQKTLASSEATLSSAPTGDPVVKLGLSYAAMGQYDKAIPLIERGIAKGTQNPDLSRLRLGTVYLAAGQKDKAAEIFTAIQAPAVTDLAKLWLVKLHQA